MLSMSQTEILAAADCEPLKLEYETVYQFSSPKVLLRSTMTIQSPDVGVLEQPQYRYVARRTNQSEQLFRRQLHKVMEAWPELRKQIRNLEAVSIPVYSRMLKKGSLGSAIFDALSTHKNISAGDLIMEVSADVLFEDLEPLAAELCRVRDMGVKIAVWEFGDPYCPLLRLRQIPYDYIILDPYGVSLLNEEPPREFESLCRFLHTEEKTRVIAPEIPRWELTEVAEAMGCDGYTLADGAEPPKDEEEDA